MKIVRISKDGRAADAVLDGESVRLLGDWREAGEDLFPASRLSLPALLALAAAPGERIDAGDVRLERPLDPRSTVICAGANYLDHVGEFRDAPPEYPALFLRNARSLVGPSDPIVAPSASETFDYEGELAVMIGKAGRRIDRADAIDHVLGYTCLMDGSVRAFQKHSVTAGKNFLRSGAIGPWIVTRDERPDLGAAALTTRIDGETVQATTLDLMIFDVPALIAYCSIWTELQPGDVISTGTPAGVGAFRQPPRWLRAGERIAVSIDGVGRLENPIVAED